MTKPWKARTILPLLALAALAAGCGGEGESATPGQMANEGAATRGSVMLTGAGATFPYPVYSKWFDAYSRSNPVRVNYQSIGSGGGIRQLTEGTVDFGASDAPMNEEEMAKAPNTLHLPTVIGAVSLTYNLPGLQQPLNLTGELTAEIFRGQVRKWNAPEIQRLNPGAQLPDRDILVVHRTDGSGTTYVFTEFLSATSSVWRQSPGTGKSVRWPTGLGAKGNEGVAGQVKQTEGAIGYVEQVYAAQNDLPTAAIWNRAGEFVQPTIEGMEAAAAGAAAGLAADTDFRVSIVDAEGAGVYPIAAWTYLLVPQNLADCGQAAALVGLGRWMYSVDADRMARELGYAPLPGAMKSLVLDRWSTLTCGEDARPVQSAS